MGKGNVLHICTLCKPNWGNCNAAVELERNFVLTNVEEKKKLASVGLRVMDSQDAAFDVSTAEPTCKLPPNYIIRHKFQRSCSTDIINQ